MQVRSLLVVRRPSRSPVSTTARSVVAVVLTSAVTTLAAACGGPIPKDTDGSRTARRASSTGAR